MAPKYNFETLTPEAAAQALTDVKDEFAREGSALAKISEGIVDLERRLAAMNEERRAIHTRRDDLRVKARGLQRIIHGLCRAVVRSGGSLYAPTLCDKKAKDGYYCGIHAASRKRREANRAKWSAEASLAAKAEAL